MTMQFDYYEVPESAFEVFTWCPTPDASGPPTQVHVHIPAFGGKAVFRFKSPRTIDQLIAALISHRTEVWGDLSADDLSRARALLSEIPPGPGPTGPGCTCGAMLATAMTTDGSIVAHARDCPAGKVTGIAPQSSQTQEPTESNK